MRPLKDIWVPIRFSYSCAQGAVHCVFFGSLFGFALDTPSAAGVNMGKWCAGQDVFGAINRSYGCEAQA